MKYPSNIYNGVPSPHHLIRQTFSAWYGSRNVHNLPKEGIGDSKVKMLSKATEIFKVTHEAKLEFSEGGGGAQIKKNLLPEGCGYISWNRTIQEM